MIKHIVSRLDMVEEKQGELARFTLAEAVDWMQEVLAAESKTKEHEIKAEIVDILCE